MKLFTAFLASLSVFAAAPASAEQTRLRDDIRAVAPVLEKYRTGVVLGEVWKRPGLTSRDRSIATLAALIARNQTTELADYVAIALDNGVKPSEVSEIITHLAFYSGWGNAMAAVAVTEDVFAARKVPADQLAAVSPQLLPLNEAAEATRARFVGDLFGAVFPGVTQYTTDVLFRDLWLRPGLAPRDRSLVTISALVATGAVAQLGSHINIRVALVAVAMIAAAVTSSFADFRAPAGSFAGGAMSPLAQLRVTCPMLGTIVEEFAMQDLGESVEPIRGIHPLLVESRPLTGDVASLARAARDADATMRDFDEALYLTALTAGAAQAMAATRMLLAVFGKPDRDCAGTLAPVHASS